MDGIETDLIFFASIENPLTMPVKIWAETRIWSFLSDSDRIPSNIIVRWWTNFNGLVNRLSKRSANPLSAKILYFKLASDAAK
ncbi:hypothetical protein [Algoriphagus terrigena]|uniref:hypothetical protein n=1 Tax=Algoriphagus terrigena TaxID=344884 RepID=UPI0012F87181|nr:hypothetical protein [Algoriphagus terrigena]